MNIGIDTHTIAQQSRRPGDTYFPLGLGSCRGATKGIYHGKKRIIGRSDPRSDRVFDGDTGHEAGGQLDHT